MALFFRNVSTAFLASSAGLIEEAGGHQHPCAIEFRNSCCCQGHHIRRGRHGIQRTGQVSSQEPDIPQVVRRHECDDIHACCSGSVCRRFGVCLRQPQTPRIHVEDPAVEQSSRQLLGTIPHPVVSQPGDGQIEMVDRFCGSAGPSEQSTPVGLHYGSVVGSTVSASSNNCWHAPGRRARTPDKRVSAKSLRGSSSLPGRSEEAGPAPCSPNETQRQDVPGLLRPAPCPT